jgi:hypothetical protein
MLCVVGALYLIKEYSHCCSNSFFNKVQYSNIKSLEPQLKK